MIHELAHSLMARHYGVSVSHIILLPIGGISVMERMPDDPREELSVAVVGPLASLGLAVLIGAAVWAMGGAEAFLHPWQLDAGHFLARLAWLNLVLAAFNLLPAFPADGGRVLRAPARLAHGTTRGRPIAPRWSARAWPS